MAKINRSPCTSCPYRRDVPSGVWHEEEYDKLLHYDGETSLQAAKLFMCHKIDNSLCRGWLDCHGGELLAVRLAMCIGALDVTQVAKALNEEPAVPVFSTAKEAARHGKKRITNPGGKAIAMMQKIERKRQ